MLQLVQHTSSVVASRYLRCSGISVHPPELLRPSEARGGSGGAAASRKEEQNRLNSSSSNNSSGGGGGFVAAVGMPPRGYMSQREGASGAGSSNGPSGAGRKDPAAAESAGECVHLREYVKASNARCAARGKRW